MIKENLPMDGYDIFVIQPGRAILQHSGLSWTWIDMQDGVEPHPTLTLQEDVLRAILQEAGKIIPATHATERHLLREIEVSDWLRKRVEELLPE